MHYQINIMVSNNSLKMICKRIITSLNCRVHIHITGTFDFRSNYNFFYINSVFDSHSLLVG